MPNTVVENADVILDRTIRKLRENTQITRFTPGSKAQTILGILASEVERLEEVLSSNIVLSLVNGASGIYLDFIGELLGVSRTKKTGATVEAASRALRIYVEESLTFGDLNNNRPILIPAGTILSSDDNQIKYATVVPIRLLPESSEEFISARAITFGRESNIADNVLTKIEFENYLTYPTPELKVQNVSSIESGVEEDSDKFFRYKIINAALSAESANLTAIRLAALSIQSVADLIVLTRYRGVGTADIILDTQTGRVSTTTIESVRRAISRVEAIGLDIRVRPPELVGLELTLDIRYLRSLSLNDKQQVNINVRRAISDLIANIPLGGSLTLNSISSAILTSDQRISDIGLPNKPLTEVVLWKTSPLTGARAPYPLRTTTDINLLIDERLTLEGSPQQAIKISER